MCRKLLRFCVFPILSECKNDVIFSRVVEILLDNMICCVVYSSCHLTNILLLSPLHLSTARLAIFAKPVPASASPDVSLSTIVGLTPTDIHTDSRLPSEQI